MGNLFFYLLVAAMASVAGVLLIGIVSMVRGGDFNKKHGNALMRARLYLQATAMGLFVLAFLTH